MSDQHNPGLDKRVDGETPKRSFFDYLSILLKWRKFIIYNVLVLTLLAVGISLILPTWYKSTASILPPKQQDLLGSMSPGGSVLRGLAAGRGLGGLGRNMGAYNYLAILKSRTALERVIREFDLASVYNIRPDRMDDVIKKLRANVLFEVQDEDYITIEVYDRDRHRAAAMANYFVEILNEISIQLATMEARNNREFIERRLQDAKMDLRHAEDALRQYQEQAGIIIVPEQNMSGVSAVAEVYAMKVRKEVELAILEKTVSKDSPHLRQLRIELAELEKKAATFPEAGIESVRLYRDVAIKQKIVEFLVPLYEQARVDEQKDVPVLLVLDKGVPADRKTRPQRSLIVFSVFFLSLFATTTLVFIMQGLSRPEGKRSVVELQLQRRVRKIADFYRVKVPE